MSRFYWHLHSQNLTDGRLPTWRHGRAWWGRFRAEWSILRSPSLGFGFRKGGGDSSSEATLNLAVLLFSVWFTADLAGLAGPFRDRESRAYYFEGSFWLSPWVCPSRDRGRDLPWYRRTIHIPIRRWLLNDRHTFLSHESTNILIPMPEGCYPATATRETYIRETRFGRRERPGWNISVEGGGIPFDGKGENSWDCGEDGLCGKSSRAEHLEDAVGEFVASVLRTRRKREGDWLHGNQPKLARDAAS